MNVRQGLGVSRTGYQLATESARPLWTLTTMDVDPCARSFANHGPDPYLPLPRIAPLLLAYGAKLNGALRIGPRKVMLPGAVKAARTL